MNFAAESEGDELLVRRIDAGKATREFDCKPGWNGEDGRRRTRGKVWCIENDGEDGTPSISAMVLGVRCNSEFSEMVSPISTCSPQLRYSSSDDFRSGLR